MLRSITSLSDPTAPTGDDSQIAALREQLSALTAQVSEIADRRLQQAKAAAEAGTEYAKEKVDDFPLTSVAIAFGAGALIGLAILPSRRRGFDWRHPSVADFKDELADYTDQMRRQLRRSTAGNGIANRFEQMADSVSQVDPKATIAPILNRLMSWAEGVKGRASEVATDVTKRVTS